MGARVAAWVEGARRGAPWVTVAFVACVVVLLLGPVRRLGVDTDTADMISRELPWRQTQILYQEAFPQLTDRMLVLVQAETPDLADRAGRRLAERMEAEPRLFRDVHVPGGGPYFRRHALLYLSLEELDSLAANVERYGSWLRRLEADPSLGGFLGTLEAMVAAARAGEDVPELAPLLGAVARAVRASDAWRFTQVSWQEILRGRRAAPEERRLLLLARPRLDHGSLFPARAAIERTREIAREEGLTPERGVRVRLTGKVPMEHEELRSVMQGSRRAGLLALLAVLLTLQLGLRSVGLTVASILTLLAGLVSTAGFAALAVGHLNLISIAFAVLFIGLGIDYAIHFSLRYRELRTGRTPHPAALGTAGRDVGASVALGAVTTAACFYAFVPTDFVGVSELGVIAGTGMFIALLCTLTLLPALLSLRPPRLGPSGGESRRSVGRRAPPADPGPLDRLAAGLRRLGRGLAAAPRRRPRLVLGLAAVAGLATLPFLPAAGFDHNPVNLRDPGTESVAAYLELLADTTAHPLTVSILEGGAEAARGTAERVAGLDVVRGTVALDDFVPEDQGAKSEAIGRIAAALGSRPEPAASSPAEPADVEALLGALARFRPFASSAAARAARYLGLELRAWLDRALAAPAERRAEMLADLERTLVGSLPGRIEALREALEPGRVTRETLPADLASRWVSPEGLHRVEVLPRDDVAETPVLRRFVEGVRAVAPDATGPPVVQLEAGEAVVRSFRSGFLYAGLATVALLLAALRRARDALYVLCPLALAGLLTVAVAGAGGLRFNFANVIALPLLLGVGVDNGIHMVHRARAAPPEHGDLLRTSTARAVVFSSLTTALSFGNLAFTGHPGTASMGALLTLGMLAVLVSTLALLPALLGPDAAGAGGDGSRVAGRVDKARRPE